MEGGKFENAGDSATTINRQLLYNALNHVLLEFKEEAAVAIREVADCIDSSGNTQASVAFNEFLAELQQPQPRPSRLKLFWDGVVNNLPSSATRDDAATKIVGLF